MYVKNPEKPDREAREFREAREGQRSLREIIIYIKGCYFDCVGFLHYLPVYTVLSHITRRSRNAVIIWLASALRRPFARRIAPTLWSSRTKQCRLILQRIPLRQW